ncbi:MAG: ABC transporter substrate-binding protein [Saprospiraceae bacterium]|nr:ABC transporter substrate-binding protein [Saprospiraceae bacterium]
MAKRIRLALDWTPNTIHTGFYVAAQKGYYEDANVEVEFLLPDSKDDEFSPAQKVISGKADLAIVAPETVIDAQIKGAEPSLIAIAALLAKDASAMVTLQTSGIEYPGLLDGRTYASNGIPFEEQLVRKLISNDGGLGNVKFVYPEKFQSWDTLLSGKADATWIFVPWEGIDARLRNVELNIFKLADFHIPYGYSPLLVGHPVLIKKKKIRKFLKATRKGYLFARNNPTEAANILMAIAQHPSLDNRTLVEQSQVFISQYYLDENGHWGIMQNKVWEDYINWLKQHSILSISEEQLIHDLDTYQLFTNDLWEE